jgi:hypothetical protein
VFPPASYRLQRANPARQATAWFKSLDSFLAGLREAA